MPAFVLLGVLVVVFSGDPTAVLARGYTGGIDLSGGQWQRIALARALIRLQDQPGALFNLARVFDRERVNIIEVYHQRVFTTLPAKGLITEIECETRDRAHLDRLFRALKDAGYEVAMMETA